jgi:hypothetical protein
MLVAEAAKVLGAATGKFGEGIGVPVFFQA